MNKTEINQLLKEISRPSQSGIILSEVLEKIAQILQADYIAYYEVQWHMSQLRLREAYPISYRQLIEGDTNHKLKVPEEDSPDFKGLGLSVLAFHDFIRDTDRNNGNNWNPVYVPDIKNPPDRYSGIYKLFKEDIRSEIAIPIAQIFNGEQQRLPLGVLLVSSKHANHFNQAMKTKNNIIRITSRSFTTAACWEFLLRVDNTWKDIYNNISTDVNCDDYDKFSDLILDSLDNSVTKAIKYASLWTQVSKGNYSGLVLQHVRDFQNTKPFNSRGALKTIGMCNSNHIYYKAFREVTEALNFSIEDKRSIAEILKDTKYAYRDFAFNDKNFNIADKDGFKEYYNINDDDRVNIIPLFSHYADPQTDVKLIKLIGLIAIYTAKDSQKFTIDPKHLEMFSVIVGNGIYNILRNKRRHLTKTISNTSSYLISKFSNFLQASVNNLRPSINCQWIGLFLHDATNSILKLTSEAPERNGMGKNIEIPLQTEAKCFIHNLVTNSPNITESANSEQFFSATDVRRFCGLYGNNQKWKDDIFRLLPQKNAISTSEFPCIATPICFGNACFGIVLAINPLRSIDEVKAVSNPAARISSFTNEDLHLLNHFAETLAPYLSIHHFASEAMLASVLQGHEIVSQARSIANKAESIRISASPIIIGFPFHDVNIMKVAADEINRGLNIEPNAYIIRNSIDNVLKQYGQWSTEKTIAQVSDIEYSSRNILSLSELHSIINMKSEDLKIRRVSFSKDLLEKLSQLCRSQFESENRLLLVEDYSGNAEIMTDKNKIDLVLWNVISNALYYSYLFCPTKINARQTGKGDIEISISNYGFGIKQSDIDNGNLFVLNWRSKNARAVRHEGTGIGLAVVSHILNTLGLGEVTVISKGISNYNIFLVHLISKFKSSEKTLEKAPEIDLTAKDKSLIQSILYSTEIINKLDRIFLENLRNGALTDLTRRGWELLLKRQTNLTEFTIKLKNQSN